MLDELGAKDKRIEELEDALDLIIDKFENSDVLVSAMRNAKDLLK